MTTGSNMALRTPDVLSCHNLWKVYGATEKEFLAHGGADISNEDIARLGWAVAMRDVTLQVHPGEVFVIMGLSGSGKSTLIRCLTRLIEPTYGDVMIGDTNLLKASEHDLVGIRRNTMGMVFQNFALLPHRTVLDNIAFPLQMQGVDRAKREVRAREMAAVVGLSGWEHRYPAELSGGQQQRVGIARSLSTDPLLWFLDEPFSALDPLIRADLQDEVSRLQEKLGKTVVFITHDLDEAIRLADRIGIMEGGRMVQIGTPEDLVLDPADDYVRRFVSKVPLSTVMTCRKLAKEGRANGSLEISADATVASIAKMFVATAVEATIVDANHSPVGIITKEMLVDLMVSDQERLG